MVRRTLLPALLALAIFPAGALAHPQAQPLVDQAPLGTRFKDRVITQAPRTADAARSQAFASYATPDGTEIPVAISSAYGGSVSPDVAQSYVDFLGSLDHGPELAQLKIYIAPPSEVQSACGGQPGTLACYDSTNQTMTVPGEQMQTSDGVTTSYVVAHEYGHHIAAFRSNAPFRAFAFGPKFWASYEGVCAGTSAGLLFPGNETDHYFDNPGEAWAETYAHLKYPEVSWQYTKLLAPDQGSFDAARRDVLQPWTAPMVKTFTGSFGAHGGPKRFALPLQLDGSISIQLRGPRGSNYSFIASAGDRHGSWSTGPRSNDRIAYDAVCRHAPGESLRLVVRRIAGSGPFSLRVTYDG